MKAGFKGHMRLVNMALDQRLTKQNKAKQDWRRYLTFRIKKKIKRS